MVMDINEEKKIECFIQYQKYLKQHNDKDCDESCKTCKEIHMFEEYAQRLRPKAIKEKDEMQNEGGEETASLTGKVMHPGGLVRDYREEDCGDIEILERHSDTDEDDEDTTEYYEDSDDYDFDNFSKILDTDGTCLDCLKLQVDHKKGYDGPLICENCEEREEEFNFQQELNDKLERFMEEIKIKEEQQKEKEKKKETQTKQVTEKPLSKKQQMKQQSRRNHEMSLIRRDLLKKNEEEAAKQARREKKEKDKQKQLREQEKIEYEKTRKELEKQHEERWQKKPKKKENKKAKSKSVEKAETNASSKEDSEPVISVFNIKNQGEVSKSSSASNISPGKKESDERASYQRDRPRSVREVSPTFFDHSSVAALRSRGDTHTDVQSGLQRQQQLEHMRNLSEHMEFSAVDAQRKREEYLKERRKQELLQETSAASRNSDKRNRPKRRTKKADKELLKIDVHPEHGGTFPVGGGQTQPEFGVVPGGGGVWGGGNTNKLFTDKSESTSSTPAAATELTEEEVLQRVLELSKQTEIEDEERRLSRFKQQRQSDIKKQSANSAGLETITVITSSEPDIKRLGGTSTRQPVGTGTDIKSFSPQKSTNLSRDNMMNDQKPANPTSEWENFGARPRNKHAEIESEGDSFEEAIYSTKTYVNSNLSHKNNINKTPEKKTTSYENPGKGRGRGRGRGYNSEEYWQDDGQKGNRFNKSENWTSDYGNKGGFIRGRGRGANRGLPNNRKERDLPPRFAKKYAENLEYNKTYTNRGASKAAMATTTTYITSEELNDDFTTEEVWGEDVHPTSKPTSTDNFQTMTSGEGQETPETDSTSSSVCENKSEASSSSSAADEMKSFDPVNDIMYDGNKLQKRNEDGSFSSFVASFMATQKDSDKNSIFSSNSSSILPSKHLSKDEQQKPRLGEDPFGGIRSPQTSPISGYTSDNILPPFSDKSPGNSTSVQDSFINAKKYLRDKSAEEHRGGALYGAVGKPVPKPKAKGVAATTKEKKEPSEKPATPSVLSVAADTEIEEDSSHTSAFASLLSSAAKTVENTVGKAGYYNYMSDLPPKYDFFSTDNNELGSMYNTDLDKGDGGEDICGKSIWNSENPELPEIAPSKLSPTAKSFTSAKFPQTLDEVSDIQASLAHNTKEALVESSTERPRVSQPGLVLPEMTKPSFSNNLRPDQSKSMYGMLPEQSKAGFNQTIEKPAKLKDSETFHKRSPIHMERNPSPANMPQKPEGSESDLKKPMSPLDKIIEMVQQGNKETGKPMSNNNEASGPKDIAEQLSQMVSLLKEEDKECLLRSLLNTNNNNVEDKAGSETNDNSPRAPLAAPAPPMPKLAYDPFSGMGAPVPAHGMMPGMMMPPMMGFVPPTMAYQHLAMQAAVQYQQTSLLQANEAAKHVLEQSGRVLPPTGVLPPTVTPPFYPPAGLAQQPALQLALQQQQMHHRMGTQQLPPIHHPPGVERNLGDPAPGNFGQQW